MKLLFLTTVLFLSFSCANSKIASVNKDVEQYEYKSKEDIKKDVSVLIKNHPELSDDQKIKISELLNSALIKSYDLKLKESQMTQHLLKLTLDEKSSYKEIEQLRNAMKQNYKNKAELFENTALKLKEIIGITMTQNNFERETSLLFLRSHMQ